MPICKNCNSRISNFDKDICPVCGYQKPLSGVTSETIEITTKIDLGDKRFEFRQVKKKLVLLFFILLGFTGAGFFYMKHKKFGFIYLAANLIFIGLGGLLISLLPNMMPFGFLITLGASYVINVVLGLILYFKKGLKDGEGEFIH